MTKAVPLFPMEEIRSIKPLKPYHMIWLAVHPRRTEAWLRARLSEGFTVHHLDLNHDNNDPKNLALIEGRDHMMIHSGGRPMLRGFKKKATKQPVGRKGRRREVLTPDGTWIRLMRGEKPADAIRRWTLGHKPIWRTIAISQGDSK